MMGSVMGSVMGPLMGPVMGPVSDRGHSRRSGESGSATVYGVGFIGLLVAVAMVAASIAGLLVGHRRAAAGADLAALAGASAIAQGRAACVEAGRLAEANDVRLVRCARSGEVVTVQVATEVVSAFGRGLAAWTVRSQARAGPVDDPV